MNKKNTQKFNKYLQNFEENQNNQNADGERIFATIEQIDSDEDDNLKVIQNAEEQQEIAVLNITPQDEPVSVFNDSLLQLKMKKQMQEIMNTPRRQRKKKGDRKKAKNSEDQDGTSSYQALSKPNTNPNSIPITPERQPKADADRNFHGLVGLIDINQKTPERKNKQKDYTEIQDASLLQTSMEKGFVKKYDSLKRNNRSSKRGNQTRKSAKNDQEGDLRNSFASCTPRTSDAGFHNAIQVDNTKRQYVDPMGDYLDPSPPKGTKTNQSSFVFNELAALHENSDSGNKDMKNVQVVETDDLDDFDKHKEYQKERTIQSVLKDIKNVDDLYVSENSEVQTLPYQEEQQIQNKIQALRVKNANYLNCDQGIQEIKVGQVTKQVNQVLHNYLSGYGSPNHKSKKKKRKYPKKPTRPLSFVQMISKSGLEPKPLELILGYLSTPCGAGIDVFKLKNLSNGIQRAVTNVAPYNYRELKQTHFRNICMEMLTHLDLQKYQQNSEVFSDLYQNPVYGGYLVKERPFKHQIQNAVTQNSIEKQIMESTNFGFYTLYNVRASANCFHDIQILLNQPPSADKAQLLASWHRKYQGRNHYEKDNHKLQKQLDYINKNLYQVKPSKTTAQEDNWVSKLKSGQKGRSGSKNSKSSRDNSQIRPGQIKGDLQNILTQLDDCEVPLLSSSFIDIDQIRSCLNGIARVTEYTVIDNTNTYGDDTLQGMTATGETQESQQIYKSKNLRITSIIEGELNAGHFEGFSRSIDHKGNCHVGFMSSVLSNTLRGGKKVEYAPSMPRPYGKWVEYNTKGAQVHSEGIYRGDEIEWDRCIRPEPIKDFVTNTEPTLTLGQQIQDWIGGVCLCQDSSQLKNMDLETPQKPNKKNIKKMQGKI